MTKTIAENIRYIDDANDSVNSNIEEVRSSVSYTLNSTTENLTLNAPLDYEIKEINGENCYVYGYPDKWNFDFEQGNGGTYIIDGKQVSMSGNCGIVSCLNLLYQKSVYSDPSEPVGVCRLGFNPTSNRKNQK